MPLKQCRGNCFAMQNCWPIGYYEKGQFNNNQQCWRRRQDATAKCTSTAVSRCSSRDTAVHSTVAEELGQGRNHLAEGRGHSHHKLTASPCLISALTTCAIDALTQQIHHHWAHNPHQHDKQDYKTQCSEKQQKDYFSGLISSTPNLTNPVAVACFS